MVRKGFLILVLAVSIAALAAGCSAPGTLQVKNAWARAAASGENSAAYFVIENGQSQPDTLQGVSGDIAASVEMHQSKMESGVMKMEPQSAVEVPAKSTVEFKPASYHIMLVNLKRDLKTGDRFDLTLTFKLSGTKTVQVTVKEP